MTITVDEVKDMYWDQQDDCEKGSTNEKNPILNKKKSTRNCKAYSI